jgi:2-dehydro-3-deoxyphosphogluconate aldolase / (4S)-4-hydroxy-2-oxoglutarate aldolase
MTAMDAIVSQRVIAIIRAVTAAEAQFHGEAIIEAGLRAVEVSMVTPGAVGVIQRLVEQAPPSVHIGVGTALCPEDVSVAADAGASFVVSPNLDTPTIIRSKELAMCSCPGVATPTEAYTAVRAGADLCKLFPASNWTPGSLRDLLASMPDLKLVPTGGIELATAPEWISAGAVAVGLGGALTGGDSAGRRDDVSELVTRLQEAR